MAIPELGTEFLFRKRPVAVPGDLRPAWRIGLLVLLLKRCCRQSRSSLTRLHVLNWTIRTEGNQQALLALVGNALRPDSLVVRFDPAFNRAVDFAIGEGLVRRVDGSRIEITAAGNALAEEIGKDKEMYPAERLFMDEIRQSVTETLVESIFGTR
ncbi:hypothetical protein AACH06_02665 [Ideonella sp. DXS29W]|uniref:Uncharacterized protein n=1 Tax=Ideonella lacteola TaxID=2984193 RepID=A0ABU9BID1_9BURK